MKIIKENEHYRLNPENLKRGDIFYTNHQGDDEKWQVIDIGDEDKPSYARLYLLKALNQAALDEVHSNEDGWISNYDTNPFYNHVICSGDILQFAK